MPWQRSQIFFMILCVFAWLDEEIGNLGEQLGNMQTFSIFLIFSVHGKNGMGWPQMGPGGFFPANPGLADILGRMDLDFENFYFFHFLDPNFLDFQVPKFWNSKSPKSGFPDFPKSGFPGFQKIQTAARGRTDGRADGRLQRFSSNRQPRSNKL